MSAGDSGASKRKGKAELQRQNLQLNESLVKFSKINYASAWNKEQVENESGSPLKKTYIGRKSQF